MENENLRQLENKVEIVGTLKSKNLKVKTSQKGNQYISGDLVIESKFDNKVQEQRVTVFVMETSKLYKGIQTVMNEYKTIDDDGRENADRVRVLGELTLNEYYNSQGKLVQFNQIRGIFFNRLDESNDQPDKAIAQIETVVEGFTEQLDSEGLPTGDYKVKAFTVGWGNEVIELLNVVIGKELAQSFMDLYQPGSTGKLTYKLNNYVELEEKKQEEPSVAHGFGVVEDIDMNNTIKNYVNNIEIIGGNVPYFGSKEYTPEEIERARKIREIKLQVLNQQQQAPEEPNGFGTASVNSNNEDIKNMVENNMPTGMDGFDFDNDMPDF